MWSVEHEQGRHALGQRATEHGALADCLRQCQPVLCCPCRACNPGLLCRWLFQAQHWWLGRLGAAFAVASVYTGLTTNPGRHALLERPPVTGACTLQWRGGQQHAAARSSEMVTTQLHPASAHHVAALLFLPHTMVGSQAWLQQRVRMEAEAQRSAGCTTSSPTAAPWARSWQCGWPPRSGAGAPSACSCPASCRPPGRRPTTRTPSWPRRMWGSSPGSGPGPPGSPKRPPEAKNKARPALPRPWLNERPGLGAQTQRMRFLNAHWLASAGPILAHGTAVGAAGSASAQHLPS